MITPCIDILRKLATQIHNDLGSRQGAKHAPADLNKDISELMRSLREHNVYVIEHGRTVDGGKASVPNTVSQGLRSLAEPLKAYNYAFKRLQRRCQMQPLVGERYYSGAALEQVHADEPSDTRDVTGLEGEIEGEGEEAGEDEEEDESESTRELEDLMGASNSEAVFSLDTPEDLEIELEFDSTLY